MLFALVSFGSNRATRTSAKEAPEDNAGNGTEPTMLEEQPTDGGRFTDDICGEDDTTESSDVLSDGASNAVNLGTNAGFVSGEDMRFDSDAGNGLGSVAVVGTAKVSGIGARPLCSRRKDRTVAFSTV